MSLHSDVSQARELHTQIESIVQMQSRSDIRLAEKLYAIKKSGLYKKAIGEGINTWVDYLRQPEIGISLHKANKLVKIYHHMIKTLGYLPEQLEGIGMHALAYVAEKELMDVDAVDELLADAAVLSEKDFRERFHDVVETTPRTFSYFIMKKCNETGSMEKVHGITSEQIEEYVSNV